ncbi:hypothetical protein BDR26DRAFT_873814, partial [Obelidium mucronatum]
RLWRSLPLPWRQNKLVGSDPTKAFLFFEGPPVHAGSVARSRRSVRDDIPVQWMAWLRHTRADPPSNEEILAADAQRLQTQTLARSIEEKDGQMRIKEQEDLAKLTACYGAFDLNVSILTQSRQIYALQDIWTYDKSNVQGCYSSVADTAGDFVGAQQSQDSS